MEFDKEKFAKRIKELRISRKLTQSDLCDKIGFEPPNYSNIETAKSTPSVQSLCKIADVLDVSMDEIFDYSHFETEENIDKLVLKTYKSFSLDKKRTVYRILNALKDLNY